MEDVQEQAQPTEGEIQEQKPRIGVVIGNSSYVWSERIDATAITLRALRDRLKLGVDITALVVGVFFLIVFFLTILFASDLSSVATSAYWLEPSFAGFALSMAVLIFAFVYYRFAESLRLKVKMPKRDPNKAPPDIAPVIEGHHVNMARLFDADAMKAVEEGYQIALRYKHKELLPLHLFIGAMTSQDVAIVFGRLGIKFDQIKDSLQRRLQEQQMGGGARLSAVAEESLLAAFLNAYSQGRQTVSALEVFFEAYQRDEFIRELMYEKKVDQQRLVNVVEWIRITGKLRERIQQFRKAAAFKPTGPMNRAMTSVATPYLDSVSEDLTAAAVAGRLPMLVGRDQELEQLFRIIEGGNQSVVLVGAEGTGKSAVLAGVAERMVEEHVPKILQDKRLVSLNIPALLSGSPEKSEERLMQALIDVSRSRNIILALPNLEQLDGELANLIVDYLDRGGTFAIGTTTPGAYTQAIERSVLGRVFEKVDVLEPERNEAIQILESKIGSIEVQNNVIFSYEAVEKAVDQSDRFMHEDFLPEKAITVCKEAALFASKQRGEGALVTGEDVSTIISEKTNIPITEMTTEEKDKLLNLEERMRERMIGQEEAVKAVANALRRGRAELRSENRPIATFLFLGPTGVGKTELAKTIAEQYFGREDMMLRFDMSEYQEQNAIQRMIGAPGSGGGGLLSEAVRKNPFSIVLLDELEKAHPDILNVFLQVFDDGRLTDAAGRTIDFTNAIIVATSNAGAEYIQDAVKAGTSQEEMKIHMLEEELKGIYRPEFLNRFDGVIVFTPLSMDEVQQIAYLMVNKVAKRLEPKGIHFRATDEAVAELAQKGYDPKFGARPLRRVVQEEVDNAIAKALLEGKVARRDTIVLKQGGEIDIEKAEAL